MMKEIIVVEGKDDKTRVQQAVDCEVIVTGGIYFNRNVVEEIELAAQKRGIIILTDPDYAGKKIRARINKMIPEAKNAYVDRKKAIKGDDVGIENASNEAIVEALQKAKAKEIDYREEFTMEDLVKYQLTGAGSKQKRIHLCDRLNIGYHNAKSLLRILNHYGITRKEFLEALDERTL